MSSENLGKPKLIFVLSGKRKSGKDYVANILSEKIGSNDSVIIRLSAPLKKQYAAEHNLDYEELLESSNYKEIFRLKMIHWGEEKRKVDPGYFCRHAIIQSNAISKAVWIVSDARRVTDLEFFSSHFSTVCHFIRIQASTETRSRRNWKFTTGVDDAESECGLDNYDKWNFIINNNDDNELFENVKPILDLASDKLNET